MRAAILLMPMLLAGIAHGAGLYKWIDAQGRVQYTDTPPPADAKGVEQRKLTPSVIQSSEQPFAVKEAAKNFPVTLWATDCGDPCTKARALLARRGVPYTERNPQQSAEEGQAFKKLSGGDMQVPLAQVGTLKTLKGFEEGEWSATLDAAGYPKSAAPLKPPAAKPPAAAPQAAVPAPR